LTKGVIAFCAKSRAPQLTRRIVRRSATTGTLFGFDAWRSADGPDVFP
jgi:hypothetical protein